MQCVLEGGTTDSHFPLLWQNLHKKHRTGLSAQHQCHNHNLSHMHSVWYSTIEMVSGSNAYMVLHIHIQGPAFPILHFLITHFPPAFHSTALLVLHFWNSLCHIFHSHIFSRPALMCYRGYNTGYASFQSWYEKFE